MFNAIFVVSMLNNLAVTGIDTGIASQDGGEEENARIAAARVEDWRVPKATKNP